ncbi:MAG: glycosyltransferase [Candidatus Desulforudis sp.]|nr:glycosyltransferase [Desulforudis sp.]
MTENRKPHLGDYIPVVGEAKVEELLRFGEELKGLKLQQINSARHGGGVAEMLISLIPLEESLGLNVTWDVITGDPAFFSYTKTVHNFLQGKPGSLDLVGAKAYWDTNRKNYALVNEQADVVLVHDPQPAGLITFVPDDVRRRQKWIWRCHIQTSRDACLLMNPVRSLIELYDVAIYSSTRYCTWDIAPFIILPYIDPLSEKNRDLTEAEIQTVLDRHGVGDLTEKPLITLVSRFDPFKGHAFAIESFRQVRARRPCQLLMVGGTAGDDPENELILAEIKEKISGLEDVRVLNLPADSHLDINALQRASSVILQPSVKEGFGLTVTEGLWKGKPVIGGDTGGIPAQIADGYNGYLITPGEGGVAEMAERIGFLLNNPVMAREMGRRGRETVRERFLITRGLWDEMMLLKTLTR